MQVETRGAPEQTRSPFKLEYDPALPITAHRTEVIEAIRSNPVIVLCGATGSGKSTQLPKLCLEAGRGVAGVIGHTQPRRIAARALANRLAEETGATVGGAIGYKVRFNDRTGPNCRIKLMTDGILLKELESDRKLRRYDTLIIDEAHERSLNIDLLLGVLKQLLPQRPDLRLIVTSATIDPGRFAAFFGVGGRVAPIIEVSGRSYPVEVRYRPLSTPREDEQNDEDVADAAELSLPEGIIEAVRDLDAPGRGNAFGQGSRGDVLVFLPGEKHIREAADALERARLPNTEVLPLFARLSGADQERIFQRHGQRRIVLATNVAETSLTVPGIRFVVDSGLARISRYSVRGKVQRLPIERVSKASADQRKGRCGREAEGICIRLYDEADFNQREDFTPPEVLRTNLASVILRMATLGLGDPESFPFLDPPDTRLVNDGVRLLQELKAMDDERRVTSLGQQIAGIPVDPRLGRMLLAASRHHCVTEMLVVASFLEGQDPRERPTDAQQQASEKHALFADPRSDFVTVLNVWRAYNEQAAALSRNQLRKWCREHFLSYLRIREWQDLHTQLTQSLAELKLRPNQMPASYTDLHQAILTGFLGSIGELDEKREYNGPRGLRFVIAPGTPLASKPPRWIVAGSIVETTKLYARMVAAVDPGWIEAAGAHLLKRSYSEPHWERARGYVSAYESVALYGLTLASRRRINYGAIAPKEAREIFIREALIETPADEVASLQDDYAVSSSANRGAVADRGDVVREARAAMGARGANGGRGKAVMGERDAHGREGGATIRERNVNDHEGSGVGSAGRSADVAERPGANARQGRGGDTASSSGRRPAFVQGEFFEANRRLRAEIEGVEAKIRRRDVVADEEHQLEFYAARIPERVNSVAAFNHWRVEAERANPRLLYMSRADLMQRDAQEAGPDRFPDAFPVGNNQLPLQYKFDPSESGDGVTLIVPEPLLDALNPEQIAWLVPGLRLEKVIAMFRALPKAQRKLLVPVPDFAKQALDDVSGEAERLGRLPGFHERFSQWVTQHVGATVTPAELASLPLPDYLRMNLRVLDADDRVLAEGRDLLAIKRKLYGGGSQASRFTQVPGAHTSLGSPKVNSSSRDAPGSGPGSNSRGVPASRPGSTARGVPGSNSNSRGGPQAGSRAAVSVPANEAAVLHRQWDFGELPETREVERNRLRLVIYPAIEDRVTGVALVEARNSPSAEAISRIGMVRLAMLALPQQSKFVSKRVTDDRDLVLLSRGLPLRQSLADALAQRAFRECFFPADAPLSRNAQDFNKVLDSRRAQLSDVADRLVITITSTLKEWRAARAALDGLRAGSFAEVVAEINAQVGLLLSPDFIESTPRPWLDYLPRYLKAITRRIERLPPNVRRDAELSAKVKPFAAALLTLMAEPTFSDIRPELEELRWMIEEFRVSLFAQELKTMIRVSDKRLSEQLKLARESQP
jgi:HrpA-like RNA helicase